MWNILWKSNIYCKCDICSSVQFLVYMAKSLIFLLRTLFVLFCSLQLLYIAVLGCLFWDFIANLINFSTRMSWAVCSRKYFNGCCETNIVHEWERPRWRVHLYIYNSDSPDRWDRQLWSECHLWRDNHLWRERHWWELHPCKRSYPRRVLYFHLYCSKLWNRKLSQVDPAMYMWVKCGSYHSGYFSVCCFSVLFIWV